MAVYQVRLVNPAIDLALLRRYRKGRTLAVPDDQYILDVAEDAGIRLPASCEQVLYRISLSHTPKT
jgi:ferredoxin